MTDSKTKLKSLLRELFQLDNADLDFGIYRIMNAKRVEIERFLDNDLLPQVKKAFQQYQSSDSVGMKAELEKTIQQAKDMGVADPEALPKVKELRAKLGGAVDVAALESQVFSDLYTFFRRYYDEGDFLSLRRYKEGVYAIPYEGEEVKLYWANHDQYYIKSTEYLRDYRFKVGGGKCVHFKLTEADTEKDNNKPQNGGDRRFILTSTEPVIEENGELLVRFEYQADSQKRRQDAINSDTVKRIMTAKATDGWIVALSATAPSKADAERTVLAKHLADYTSRNSFDYFIHKDVEGFLRRELDFYLKSEVMHLDDIESDKAAKVEQYISRLKVLRGLAGKIITFISHLEDFQKRLWLKKKFVVETNYCITLDRIPEKLHKDIASNDSQREEWVRLFAIDAIEGDLARAGYSKPLTTRFLKENPHLLVDTKFFDEQFKASLLAAVSDVDDSINGLLIHSDNFQAMSLIGTRLQENVKCIYIDPPYNTASSSIPYKNNYRHSSWCSMMHDRLSLLRPLLPDDGAIFVSIDKTERTTLEYTLDSVFGANNRIEELVWAMNTTNSQVPNYSTNHEYVLVYAKNKRIAERDATMFREPKPGYEEVMELVAKLNPSYPSIEVIERELKQLYESHRIEFQTEMEALGLEWEDEKSNDPWKGIYNYANAEYRDDAGKLVPAAEAKKRAAKIWVWKEADSSMPATKQAASTRDKDSPNWRFYKPSHPVTGKPCPHPKSGWKFAFDDDEDSPDRRSFVALDRDGRIAWGSDENKVPQLKRMLHEVETNIGKSVFQDYSDGEKQTSAMFGRSGVFLAPKHSDFVSRFIRHAAKRSSIILDCFGGSGSTAHAVINLNREDHGSRKYVTAEMATYFNDVLKPRVMKAVYASKWKAGKPADRESGMSHCMKYVRLESYEDTLNNLSLSATSKQQSLLAGNSSVREDYTLRYMLDVETKGSSSLLSVTAFNDPFGYTLNIATGTVGETTPTKVDLVETFNWLLGLHVKTIDTIKGVRVVTGTSPQGEKVLVLWRTVKDMPSPKLDEFFQKQGYNTKDMEFDVIYVNGDNNLENLKKDEDTWKVRLIEEDFKRLMFDVQDV